MIKNPTFGSDIEVLLKTKTGEFFPVCGIVGGTKEKPRALGGGYYIQEDNVLCEFNVPVATNMKEFATYISSGLQKVMRELPPSLEITAESTASFNPAYLKGNPQALTFGCEPDYDAWTVEQNPKPVAKDPNLRSAAGHIHIGWDNPTPEDQLALIRWADILVTLPSVYESSDRKRRELYGKAGAFRPKPYGVEHRTLDNYWIWNSTYLNMIYSRYCSAIERVNSQATILTDDVELIKKAINEYDINLARSLHKKYSINNKSEAIKAKTIDYEKLKQNTKIYMSPSPFDEYFTANPE